MECQYIIYDGECMFCNKYIMFIAKSYIKNCFKFTSNLSNFGIKLLSKYNICGMGKSTIILTENNNMYIKSSAIKKTLLNLQYYNVFGKLMILLPEKTSNYVYGYISINREKIIKNSNCEIPNSKISRKLVM